MSYEIPAMEPLIEQILRDFRIQQDENVMRAVGEIGIHVDKPRLLQALTDARKFYEEGYRAAMRNGLWVNVSDRLPKMRDYMDTTPYGRTYLVRLLIAYKTDIVEYTIGYYDGYKWMAEGSMRRIEDVVAWRPFMPLPEPPKEG